MRQETQSNGSVWPILKVDKRRRCWAALYFMIELDRARNVQFRFPMCLKNSEI